jgi:SAM-dependent methyltransferase
MPPQASKPVYDSIGTRYTLGRQADPTIAEALRRVVEGADSILNVGAGTGSYEPCSQRVVAVEPSMVMIRQRSADAQPAVRGVAESLPFAARSFDAAMAVLTVHHWSDRRRGLLEMRRVARGPVVIFMADPDKIGSWWLPAEYFPATARLVESRSYPLELVADALGQIDVITVPIPANCRDGFEGAYWKRPHAFLDPAVWGSMSALQMIPESDRVAGMTRLAQDLESGEWESRFGHLAALDHFDVGYRLVVSWA